MASSSKAIIFRANDADLERIKKLQRFNGGAPADVIRSGLLAYERESDSIRSLYEKPAKPAKRTPKSRAK